MSDASDRLALEDTLQRYSFALDSFDYDGLLDVFDADATIRYHGHDEVHGNAAIAAFLRERTGTTTWQQHAVTVRKVTMTDDGAKAESAFIAHLIGPSYPNAVRMFLGTYSDVLVRRPIGWRIIRRDQFTGHREVRSIPS